MATKFKIGVVGIYFAVFVLGAVCAGAGLYFTAISRGDRLVKEGLGTIAELKVANTKLSADLESATASVAGLARQLSDRQRVINSINVSVKRLDGGLQDSVSTIDDIILTIQEVIRLLQDG